MDSLTVDSLTVSAELVMSLALGIGLSAACGFRVFVPFLFMNVAAQAGYLDLAEGWSWIGSIPALIIFATATILEVTAYYVPWLDNLLDSIATPAAIVAGIVATAAVISGMSPLLTWTLAAIAGGGTAGLIQTGTVMLRGMSSTTTFGAGNAFVSTSELFSSVMLSMLPFVLPWLTVVFVALLLLWVWRRIGRRIGLSRAAR